MDLNHIKWSLVALLLLQTSSVLATFWTVTSYYQLTLSRSRYVYGTETDDANYWTETVTQWVKATVTPTAKPISSTTSVFRQDNVTVVYICLPDGAVAQSDIQTPSDDSRGTIWEEPVV